MKIGRHQLNNHLILAPMAGVTDRPFRQICKDFGASIAVSEMVSANPLLRNTRKSRLRLDHYGETGLRWIQIAGAEATELANAAKYNVEQGADIIDINMGCPAKKVCRKSAGSALLADEPLVEDICSQVVNAVDVPVTLKIRTGMDRSNKNAISIAKIADRTGISALSIHGRTRADKFQGIAEYETVQAVREIFSKTLIANGDIDSGPKAQEVLSITQADGLMIGRSALGKPWLFREINHFLENGVELNTLAIDEVEKTLLGHIEQLHLFYGFEHGLKIARKHLGWYLNHYPSTDHFKKYFNKITGAKEQLLAISAWFEQQQLSAVR